MENLKKSVKIVKITVKFTRKINIQTFLNELFFNN